jgi:zinc D-Ala-D-Ala carboxypeptidase
MNEWHAKGGSGNSSLSEHFSANEFRCKCCGKVHVDPELINKLEEARAIYGKPVRVTSGYRCESHNSKVGGAQHSQHCSGKAADIQVNDSHDRFRMLQAFLQAGFKRIGVYRGGWVHVDVGDQPNEVCWVE